MDLGCWADSSVKRLLQELEIEAQNPCEKLGIVASTRIPVPRSQDRFLDLSGHPSLISESRSQGKTWSKKRKKRSEVAVSRAMTPNVDLWPPDVQAHTNEHATCTYIPVYTYVNSHHQQSQ